MVRLECLGDLRDHFFFSASYQPAAVSVRVLGCVPGQARGVAVSVGLGLARHRRFRKISRAMKMFVADKFGNERGDQRAQHCFNRFKGSAESDDF